MYSMQMQFNLKNNKNKFLSTLINSSFICNILIFTTGIFKPSVCSISNPIIVGVLMFQCELDAHHSRKPGQFRGYQELGRYHLKCLLKLCLCLTDLYCLTFNFQCDWLQVLVWGSCWHLVVSVCGGLSTSSYLSQECSCQKMAAIGSLTTESCPCQNPTNSRNLASTSNKHSLLA